MRGMWWKCAVCAAAVSGCFSEPGDWGYPGGSAGEPSAGRGGSGPSAGTGGNATGGGPAAGRGGQGGGNAGHGGSIGGGAGRAGSGGTSSGGSGNAGSGNGGSGNAGTGSGGTGNAGSCASAEACGGNVVGNWTVASSCLDVEGEFDVRGLGLGCSSARITGSRVVAGTLSANADGTYADRTTTSGEDRLELADECLTVSGTLVACERIGPIFAAFGYESATCTQAPAGGCLCYAVFEHTGGMGVLSLAESDSGTYRTSGDVLTLVDDFGEPTSYEYCASGDQLTLRPNATDKGELRGSIVLARQ